MLSDIAIPEGNRDEQAKSIGIDFSDKCWHFAERVQRLVNRKGFTREEVEEIVKTVIIFHEGPSTSEQDWMEEL